MQELQFYNKRFEAEVRKELQIYDRAITDNDALKLYGLDCSNFTFDVEDCDTLCAFKRFDRLDINIGFEERDISEIAIRGEQVLYPPFC